jgi:hypothetical protein
MGKGMRIILMITVLITLITLSLSARTFTINAGSGICPGVWGLNSIPNGGGWCGSATISVPDNWTAARIWGRTGCNTSTGFCATGDCGYKIACSGATGVPPVTLAEFTLAGANGLDFYDGSMVDGVNNVTMSIVNSGGTKSGNGTKYDCGAPSCTVNIAGQCPSALQYKNSSGAVVGCYSACMKYNTDAYCCRGSYGSPGTCAGTSWAKWFKNQCPLFYSYAYDDSSSTYTCKGGNYTVTMNLTSSSSTSTSSTSSSSSSSSSTSSTSTSSGASTTITSGSIYEIVNVTSGKAIDVANASTAAGAKVQQYTRNNNNAQRWKIIDMGNGLKFIAQCSGMALDCTGASGANAVKLEQWNDNGNACQRWGAALYGTAWKFWTAQSGARCIDVPNASTADAVQLQIWDDNGNNAQRWYLYKK